MAVMGRGLPGGRAMRSWAVLLVGSVTLAACSDDDPGPGTPALNAPPTITQLPDTTGSVGDTLHLQASALDPDGDELRFQLAVLMTLEEFRDGYRPEVGMDGATGSFWFVPGYADRPTRELQVAVEDEFGARDSTRFVVSVP